MSLGVAQVKLLNGSILGRKAKPFSYTGKVLLSMKDYDIKMKVEMKHVQNLKGKGAPWLVNSQNG